MDWTSKLVQLGVPIDLASRMAPDLQARLPHTPDQFTSLQQLESSMRSYGFQALGWWEDLQAILAQIVALIPGFVLIGVGGAMAYFLRNMKVKGVPLALVGLPLIGYGSWMVIQPFLPQPGV